MGLPYDTETAEVVGGHARIKQSGTWRAVEDIHVKDGGTWRDTKEVWVKHGGSWRSIHEGDHFCFGFDLTGGTTTNEWSLSSSLSSGGWNGSQPVKGKVHVKRRQQRINLGNMPSDSRVYLKIDSGARIQGRGGDGGNRGGQNGQGGQRALYTRTPTIVNNAGMIAGGGGGGGGGQNAQCVYQNTYNYGCMKGQQCQGTDQQFSQALGGGGGGGAGVPGGDGRHGGHSGQHNSGGGGGGNGGCGSNSGASGGGIGGGGQNANGGSGGGAGTAIDGKSNCSQFGSGYGDVRGPQTN